MELQYNSTFGWLLSIGIILGLTRTTFGQVGCEDYFGTSRNAAQNDNDAAVTTEYYILEQETTCCGKITKYHVYTTGTGTLNLLVWANTAIAGTYTLIAETALTQNTGNTDQILATPIRIAPGYRIGWRSPDGQVKVDMKNGGGGLDARYTSTFTGPTHSWTAETLSGGSEYAIRPFVTAEGSNPIFLRPTGTTSISVLDSLAIGDEIFQAIWTDPDTEDIPLLTLTMAETTTSYFTMDAAGKVTVNAALTDILKPTGTGSPVTLTFTVTDPCSKTDVETLTVNIINVPPTITNIPFDSTISDSLLVAQAVYTIAVTDPTDTPSCSTPTIANSPFTVDLVGTDYVINYSGGYTFDYDTKFSFPISVTCTDDKDTDVSVFTVYLTRNAPPLITNLPDSVTIAANAPVSFSVFDVVSTDAESDTLTYSLTCDEATCPFDIANNGAITLNTDISASTLVGYDVSVKVTDGNTLVGPKVLTVFISGINVNPTISNLPDMTTLSVLENTATASSIFDVDCMDENVPATQSLTFTMTSATLTASTYFTIGSTDGIIKVGSSSPDYEVLLAAVTTSFVFTVSCSDGQASSTVTLTIAVTNRNEAPTFNQNGYSMTATEGAAGTDLGLPNFGVTDPDSGDTKFYTQDCGTSTGYFLMAPADGRMSLLTLYDTDSVSYPATVVCTVTVKDSGELTSTTSLTIYMGNTNDNNPVFSPSFYSFFAAQDAAVSSEIGAVSALDSDTGTDGQFTYTLDQTSLGTNYFSIDSAGKLYVNSPLNALTAGTILHFKAQATDATGTSYTANVDVTISETVTATTTVASDRYLSFFEDPTSIIWFAACMVLLGFIVVIFAFMLIRGYIPIRDVFSCCFKPTRKKLQKPKMKRFRAPPRRVEMPPRAPTPPPPTPPPPRQLYIPPTPIAPPKPASPRGFNFWSDGDIHKDPGI